MVLLGVILVLLAAAAGVVLIAGTSQLTDSVQIDVLGGTLSIPPLTLLITGMVVISVFWLGWAMLRGGLHRAKRRRVEAKEAAATAEARRRDDAEEQKRLQEESAARERALVEERRLREQAEARAGSGSGSDEFATASDRPATTGRSGEADATRVGDTTVGSVDERSDASARPGDRQA
ncbi:MAG TPA: hypothetical protein VES93_08770 [Ornithinibacter sp.]|nr:hypothetical protein [Ornithinibacter sp.]